MQFLFYFAVCLGSFLLSLQLFTSTTTKKGPADDLFFAELNRRAVASGPYSTQSPATRPGSNCARDDSSRARDGSGRARDRSSRARDGSARPTTTAAPETTSAPVVAGQAKNQLAPKVVSNARAEAAPKKKRVASKYPRDDDPRNPIWWLWGLSDVR